MNITKANNKTATLLNTRQYKNHKIEKISCRGLKYYTVDNFGMYWYLKDAKKHIDKNC